MTTAEIARAARAALRKAFPGSKKISVTSSGDTITVRWTDYGPGKEELQEALLAAGCAEVKENFRGERYLVTPGDRYGLFWIDRYNAAELRPRASTRQGPQPRRGDPDRALCLRQGDRRMNAPLEPAHSPFGGSVSTCVLHCPASVGLVEKVPAHLRRASAYAERGTALHGARL